MQQLKKILPRNLQQGIPGSMAKDLDSTFWGTQLEQGMNLDEEVLDMVGIGKNRKDKERQKNKNFNAAEAYKSKGVEVECCNARQAFQKIKGIDLKETFAKPSKCHQQAPEDINVYSDGSCKNNKKSIL